MSLAEVLLLSAFIFVAALLYSSVGHGGASGYLAAMALFGLAPEVMRPAALVLNILVAAVAAARFWRAGHFSARLFWPFAVASIPLAFLGGALSLPDAVYRKLLGIVLLFAAWRLSLPAGPEVSAGPRPMPLPAAVPIGAGIGLLAGLTGVGGGIFLSPLLLLGRWAQPKTTAAVSATFIWVNSVAGLAGRLASVRLLPGFIALWALAALLGGLLGSGQGSRKLASVTLRRLLAVVLVIAGLKLILG